jgi:hypothetical protein
MTSIKLNPIPDDYFEHCKQKYGEGTQYVILHEELSELSIACNELQKLTCKIIRGLEDKRNTATDVGNAVDHIYEEIADVRIMLEQFIYTKQIEFYINDYTKQKLAREGF